MALSNWLTRNEWSAAFIAGWWLSNNGKIAAPNASAMLREGICYLDRHGYTSWGGVKVLDNTDPDSVEKDETGRYGVESCTAEGDNSMCLLELMGYEPFDLNRFREVRRWIDATPTDAPEFVSFLDETLTEIDANKEG